MTWFSLWTQIVVALRGLCACATFDLVPCNSTIIAAMLSDGNIATNTAQAAAFRTISGVQGVLDPQKRLELVRAFSIDCR